MIRRAAVLAALGLVIAAAAASAATGWRTYSRTGFSVSVPARWQVVPPSDAALKALILRLAREHQTALANQLRGVAAARRTGGTTFVFQAFQWPAPSDAVLPDVAVRSDPLAAGTTAASLRRVAAGYAKALASPKGARIGRPAPVDLPAGRAYRVAGSFPIAKSLRSGFVVYLLVHGGRLWSISYRASAARTAAEGALVRQLADGFRFS